MKAIRKYASFEELTPTLLWEFVEIIVIHGKGHPVTRILDETREYEASRVQSRYPFSEILNRSTTGSLISALYAHIGTIRQISSTSPDTSASGINGYEKTA